MKDKLYKKYKKIESNKFLQNYLESFSVSKEEIKNYYKVNHIAYRLFHSLHGFMHFRIASRKMPRFSDIYYQPKKVSEYIKPNDTVVELGCGQGSNLLYLAKRHKDANFIGIDLLKLRFNKKKYPNVKSYCQDYTDISNIPDNSVDVVYAIETIVHNKNKDKVFNEVSRILKKDGILIIYDNPLTKEYDEFLPHIQECISIVTKCGVSPIFESENTWNKYLEDSGLKIISITDFTKNILFDLKRLKYSANLVMWNRLIIRIVFSIFPKLFCGNILIGWAAYDGFNENIIKYNEWILKK